MPDKLTQSLVRTKADEAAVAEGCRVDLKRAERVRDFLRKFCVHSKGEWAGKPFELQEFQWTELVLPLFGWVRPDGTRRFRRAYVEWPKKQGKSTTASGIGLYMLVGDGEAGAEIYSAANDREQAGIVHGEAVRMVNASPSLGRYLDVNKTTHNIAFPRTNSWYRALSAEAETKEGLNAHCVIIDELHAWKGRRLWDTLRYAGRARRQPLLFVITTAGDDVLSVCYEQHTYARGILRGDIVDSRFFAQVRAARQRSEGDEVDDDWTDKETWKRANPSLGTIIKEDDFAAEAEEAKKIATVESSFKRYSLNIWATSTNPWLRGEDWSKCAREYTAEDLHGLRCFGGLDLASTRDLCAFVLCFPWDTETYRLLPYFWLPEDTVRDPSAPEQYRVWRRAGLLKTTPGNVTDYAQVRRDIGELSRAFRIHEFAFDPWNAEKLTQEIEEEFAIKRFAFGQTIYNFAGPCKEFERLLLAGRLQHPGNPILTWQAGHVQVRSDPSGNLRPVKPEQGDRRKIDGIVAALMALARAMLSTEGPSRYETEGISFV
jgi:phage terminase large subunit-like protein